MWVSYQDYLQGRKLTVQLIVCESVTDNQWEQKGFNRFNPRMHLRCDDRSLGVRVSYCGLRVTQDCPHVSPDDWGEEDCVDYGDEARVWCKLCERRLLALRKKTVVEPALPLPPIMSDPEDTLEPVPEFVPKHIPMHRHPRSGVWQLIIREAGQEHARNAGTYYGHSDNAFVEAQRKAWQHYLVTKRAAVALMPLPVKFDE